MTQLLAEGTQSLRCAAQAYLRRAGPLLVGWHVRVHKAACSSAMLDQEGAG